MRRRFSAATGALVVVIVVLAGLGWAQIGEARSHARQLAILHSMAQYTGLVGYEGFRVAYDPDPEEREEARGILAISLHQLAQVYVNLSGSAEGLPELPSAADLKIAGDGEGGSESGLSLEAMRAEAEKEYRAAPLPRFIAADGENSNLRILWESSAPWSGASTVAMGGEGQTLKAQIAELVTMGASLLDPGAMTSEEIRSVGRRIEILAVLRVNPKLNLGSAVFAQESERNFTRLAILGVFSVVTLLAGVTASLFGVLLPMERRVSAAQDDLAQANAGLEARVNELSVLLAQNEQLRGRVQRASRRIAEVNEQYLRRVGADLHDGPAQLLALAALRLDALKPAVRAAGGDPQSAQSDIQVVRESLTSAMAEIRNISTGLTLPELDNRTPIQLLREAAKAHERPTRTTVELVIESAPEDLPKATKICLYRFVQETLSNAFRHAGGVGQRLSCRFDGTTLEVVVSDEGPGFDLKVGASGDRGLGLPGLRERVESIGGTLEIESMPGAGARIILRCNVTA
ncbi:MAG TPA: ATP-binding protein [Thermohalobaculum sp.]|nr:ATP-binding protein [Thermohalobaculum sp.]